MSESHDSSEADRLLEIRVAKAIFESQRQLEIQRQTKVALHLDKYKLFAEIAQSKDAYKILISGWALTSYALSEALKIHCAHATDKDKKELFGPLGPLGTDSGKIRLARAFGWITPQAQQLLDQIRKARNKIAHEVDTVTQLDLAPIFSAPYSEVLSAKLEIALRIMRESRPKLDSENESLRYASLCVLLSQAVFEWILWGPSRERLGLPTEENPTFFAYDEAPEWAQSLNKAVVGAMFIIHST
jgi:hypothetical protein